MAYVNVVSYRLVIYFHMYVLANIDIMICSSQYLCFKL